jgi:hypothetical protein
MGLLHVDLKRSCMGFSDDKVLKSLVIKSVDLLDAEEFTIITKVITKSRRNETGNLQIN